MFASARLEPHAFRRRLGLFDAFAANASFLSQQWAQQARLQDVRLRGTLCLCHSGVNPAELCVRRQRFVRAPSRLLSALSGFNKFATAAGKIGAKPARVIVWMWQFPARKRSGDLVGI